MDKSFLLRQKNIDTFQYSNCLFGIACMERLKGEAMGRNIQKKEEALSTRPNPAPTFLTFILNVLAIIHTSEN